MLYGSYIQPSRLASPKERLCFSGLIAEWGLRKGREWRARISSPPLPHHLPAGPTGEASGPGTRMAHCPSPGGQQTRWGGRGFLAVMVTASSPLCLCSCAAHDSL